MKSRRSKYFLFTLLLKINVLMFISITFHSAPQKQTVESPLGSSHHTVWDVSRKQFMLPSWGLCTVWLFTNNISVFRLWLLLWGQSPSQQPKYRQSVGFRLHYRLETKPSWRKNALKSSAYLWDKESLVMIPDFRPNYDLMELPEFLKVVQPLDFTFQILWNM